MLTHSCLIANLTYAHAWTLILAGFIQLRGLTCKNPLQQLYAGDALCVGLAPLEMRGYSALVRCSGPRVLWRSHRNSSDTSDAPAYLEVDELCAAAVVLAEPRTLSLDPTTDGAELPFLTLKCYN